MGLLHIETYRVIAQAMWCILEKILLPRRKILEEKKSSWILI